MKKETKSVTLIIWLTLKYNYSSDFLENNIIGSHLNSLLYIFPLARWSVGFESDYIGLSTLGVPLSVHLSSAKNRSDKGTSYG